MTKDEVKELIPQLVAGNCNRDNTLTFESWITNADSVEVAEILDLYYTSLTKAPLEKLDFSVLINKIESKLNEADNDSYFNLKPTNKLIKSNLKVFSTRRWMSVAAIFLLIIGGAFLLKTTLGIGNSIASIDIRYKNDVAPGSNKAILTLGNGSKIDLVNTKDGIIESDKGVKIDKAGETVIYKSNSPKYITSETVFNTITTPRGGQYQLALPDGSKVWMNNASSIKFPVAFSGNTREVVLSGEAYFEVAKNPNKPFIVHVNDLEVKVLGTHFNIMCYSDESSIKTTLIEGSVKLSKGNFSELLYPGKIASFQHQSFTVADADIEQELAWKNGYFIFNKSDIETIMRQLARWYDVNVNYEGAKPKNLFVGQIKKEASLAESLKIIELSGIHFKIEGRNLIVMEN